MYLIDGFAPLTSTLDAEPEMSVSKLEIENNLNLMLELPQF
jgi:hypothetical protein